MPRKIKRKPKPLHLVDTKNAKDAYGRALKCLASKFGRKKYVSLEPKTEEIAKKVRFFVNEAIELNKDVVEANEKIMTVLNEMVLNEEFEVKDVEHLVLPNGLIDCNGNTFPIDPHCVEAQEIGRILRLYI